MSCRVVWLAAVFLAAPLAGSQEKAGAREAGVPRFASRVEQVVVDALVLDHDGVAVTGLGKDDFVVEEDGVPQTVVGFERVVPADQSPPRTFALVLDDVNLTRAQGERAAAVLGELVRTRTAGADRVLLFAASGKERWAARSDVERSDLLTVLARLHGLLVPDVSAERITDAEAYRIDVEQDGRTLALVADRYRAASVLVDSRGDGSIERLLSNLARFNAGATYDKATRRVQSTLSALEGAVAALADARGRKVVVLASPGVFYEPSSPYYRRVLDACRRANAAIYLLDVAGIEAMPIGLTAQVGSPIRFPDAGNPMSEREADQAGVMSAHYAQARDGSAGAVLLRSETRFRWRPLDDMATVTTVYRVEPSLRMWVPAEMRERYEGGTVFGGVSEAVARYSRYRQFGVSVREDAVHLPPP